MNKIIDKIIGINKYDKYLLFGIILVGSGFILSRYDYIIGGIISIIYVFYKFSTVLKKAKELHLS